MTIPLPLRRWALSAALLVCAPMAPAAAQSSIFDSIPTAHGYCRVWVSIPGGTGPADRSYAPCAVDRPAVLLSPAELPQPWTGAGPRGDFTVVVNADGSADAGLTRAWSIGMDSLAYRLTLETLRSWRFRPAVRRGVAVRSGFRLEVVSDARNDTLPAVLRWRYLHHPLGVDSLVGHWERVAPAPGPSEAQRDSAWAAILRRLVAMRVLTPRLSAAYCIVRAGGDESPPTRRLQSVLYQALPERRDLDFSPPSPGWSRSEGCERQPGAVRLFLPRLAVTENDRVVAYPAGDFLEEWRPGRERAYPGWTSRCVAWAPAEAPARVHCDVSPRYRGSYPWPVPPGPRWYQPGDSIHLTAFARMNHAYQTDTLRSVVVDLRRFGSSAVVKPKAKCTNSWQLFSRQRDSVYVVSGDLGERGSLYITEATQRTPPVPPRGARCEGPADSLFAAFILGDLGQVPRQPLTLCTGSPLCVARYQIDPARHTMAAHAHLRFRVADLRPDTRPGDQLSLRLEVDPVPEGLMPLIVVRNGRRAPVSAWPARRVELNAWEFGVTYDPRFPVDGEVLVYLVAR